MRNKVLALLTAGLLAPLFSGCYTNHNVVRGQTPQEGVAPGGGIQTVGFARYGGPADSPYYGYGNYGGYGGTGAYPYALQGSSYGAGCPNYDCQGGWCAPAQFHRMKYKTPSNLSYPEPSAGPAVVQYPYYTHKGPDCFFYTGE